MNKKDKSRTRKQDAGGNTFKDSSECIPRAEGSGGTADGLLNQQLHSLGAGRGHNTFSHLADALIQSQWRRGKLEDYIQDYIHPDILYIYSVYNTKVTGSKLKQRLQFLTPWIKQTGK